MARNEHDGALAEKLDKLSDGAFPGFRRKIAAIDRAYLYELNVARTSAGWQRALKGSDKQCLNQTSVIGLPMLLEQMSKSGSGLDRDV